ncbi:hypothetical protein ACFLWR_02150 [Chloroflexota bacterium]
MNIYSDLQTFVYLPPDEGMLRGEMEYRKENKAPDPKPGDKYATTGAFIGAVIGLILGLIYFSIWNPIGLLACVVGGGFAGILVGTLTRKCIMKYKNRTKGKSNDRH